jgi:ABC-type nitrate/sulfonate/bicarbonate transport system permease component
VSVSTLRPAPPASAAAAPAPATRVRTGLPMPVTQALVLVGLVAVWQLVDAIGVVSAQALSGPVEVSRALVELLTTSAVWAEIGQTLTGWSIGLGVATAIAIPLGMLLGASSPAYRSSRFVIDFLRTIPALGIIPLASLLYGSTRSTELLIVIPACLWPLLLQTIYGVRDVDPVALESARSFRLGRRRTLTRVVLPSATPFIATGLRIAAVIGMLLAISVELLVRVPGVGNGLARAQGNAATDDVYAYTVIAGVMGLVVVLAFARIERALIHWHPSQRSTS